MEIQRRYSDIEASYDTFATIYLKLQAKQNHQMLFLISVLRVYIKTFSQPAIYLR